VESAGWVRNVTFSPGGDTLAFCSHNSSVSFVDVMSGSAPQVLRLSDLPLTHLLFLPDGCMVGVGHCYDPILFVRTAQGWATAGKLVRQKRAGADKAAGGFAGARAMFQAQVAQGQGAAAAAADKASSSAHQNLVCGMSVFGKAFGASPYEFTTSALDGKIVFWTRDEVSAAMGALAIS